MGAVALLTKYYSLVLFVTLLIAAALHPRRREYLCSARPYLTVAVGLLLIAPHIWWVIASGFPTVTYAMSKMHYSVADARISTIKTLISTPYLLGLSALGFFVSFGDRSWAALKEVKDAIFRPSNAWLVSLALGPLVLTLATYLLANARITTGFLIPDFFVVPIILLVLSRVEVSDSILARFASFVGSIWLLVIAVAPIATVYSLAYGPGRDIEPRQEVAQVATDYWHAMFGRPLKAVAGEARFATATTFYSPDAPTYFDLDRPSSTPWVSSDQIRNGGLLIICPARQADCLRRSRQVAGASAPHFDYEATAHFLGFKAKPQAFVFVAPQPEK